MKKFFAVPLAVVFIAACSESTTPTSTADLNTRNAKPAPPPTTTQATGNLATSLYTFDLGAVDAASGTGIGSDTDDATVASNAADVNYVTPLLRDSGLVLLAGYLAWRPRSMIAMDRRPQDQLESEGSVRIIQESEAAFGPNPLLAASVIAWAPSES